MHLKCFLRVFSFLDYNDKSQFNQKRKIVWKRLNLFQVIPTFDSMGLREDLLRGIYAYGFEKPSAIQQRAIKPVIMAFDLHEL